MYIYQLKEWPHLTWQHEAITSLLAQVRFKQGLLLGKVHAIGFHLTSEVSLSLLTEDIVKTSAIEGEILNPDMVRSSIVRKLGLHYEVSHASTHNVDGIVDVILDATQNYKEPLTKDRLFSWHKALFPMGQSGLLKIDVGQWRSEEKGPMQIVSGYYGKEKVHYEAPEASRLDPEMDIFLTWFNASLSIDPILKSAVAHFWFVTLHPFEDGNGRMARAIADMALVQSDNSPYRFYGMSAQVEKEREDYYNHLEFSQKGGLDITSWIQWFLHSLGKALDTSETTITKILFKHQFLTHLSPLSLNPRQLNVIHKMLDDFQGFMNTSKYSRITKCSHDTGLRDIKEMVNFKILTPNVQGGRSTSYRLNIDFIDPEN